MLKLFLLVIALLAPSSALNNGVGRKPPMGWNSWFALGCSNSMNATTIRNEADLLVEKGFQKLGYEYVNLDDCMIEPGGGGRDPVSHRLQPANKTFGGEAGIKELSSYLHSKGLKFGIYTDRGTETCMHRVGSRHYESQDAQSYAEWGVDFVKEDSCGAYQNPDKAIPEYSLMRDALNATGRPVFFSLCGWHDWYAPPMPSLNYSGGYSLGNSARIARDDNSWSGVLAATDVMSGLTPYARPGYWNDPDLLLSVDISGRLRLSELQSRAQFSLWCVMSAPLLVSGSLAAMSEFTLATYSNPAAIAINQAAGVQGTRLMGGSLAPCAAHTVTNCTNVWGKTTSPRSWALLLINAGGVPAAVGCDSTCLSALGVEAASLPLKVLDVWNGTSTVITELQLPGAVLAAAGGHRLLALSAP